MPEEFSERFSVHQGNEQLNNGSPHYLGTMAANVFVLPALPPDAPYWPSVLLEVWPSLVSSLDLPRLQLVLRSSPNARWSAIRRRMTRDGHLAMPWVPESTKRDLQQLRKIAESLVGGYFAAQYREPAFEDYSAITADMVRWEGVGPNGEDFFRTTPAGAVLLSAVYGVFRGGLRLCRGCGKFEPFAKGSGFKRTICDTCKDLSAAKRPSKGGLPSWKQVAWGKALDRLRKTGFKRLGFDAKEDQERWKQAAKAKLLYAVKRREEIPEWERESAPRGKPGPRGPRNQPRVQSHAGTQSGCQLTLQRERPGSTIRR